MPAYGVITISFISMLDSNPTIVRFTSNGFFVLKKLTFFLKNLQIDHLEEKKNQNKPSFNKHGLTPKNGNDADPGFIG
jgi:hypothetical protein